MSLYEAQYNLKISFEDLDPMNIVWHGNYVRYMEQARCDLFDKLNYTYRNMKADGYCYPVVKMQVKYIKPAEFGDELTIVTKIVSVEPSLDIEYVIFNKATGERIFVGNTVQIAVKFDTKESVYIPPEGLLKALKKVAINE